MTQQVQEKIPVRVIEKRPGELSFRIPGELLPAGYARQTVFYTDNLQDRLPEDDCPDLHKLCRELLPPEHCGPVAHIIVARGDSYTEFQIQLKTDKSTSRGYGRIDAALRSCGCDPEFSIIV